MKIVFQIDPLAKLNLKRDTSLTLAFEAQRRGYDISYYHPQDIFFKEGKVYANARPFSLALNNGEFAPTEGPSRIEDLGQADVVLMRQDPPFDMPYVGNTYLLDQIADNTLILNNPSGVRNGVEKLLPLEFPSLVPPTLISQDWLQVEQFCNEHKEVIIKPLLDFGGHSVFLVNTAEGQIKGLFQLLTRTYPGLPMIVQPFLKQVLTGDKRLILIDGELIGGFTRIPIKGEVRSNQLMGGTVEKCDITARDLEICATIKPLLHSLGLFFVGIDVIGEYLIEINVTSPTGLVPLKELTGVDGASIFWDKAEKIIQNRGKDGSKYYHSRISGNRRPTD